jgi:catechol 2,3-dioxygenase-like lactoylglutathione lyase family enzyme
MTRAIPVLLALLLLTVPREGRAQAAAEAPIDVTPAFTADGRTFFALSVADLEATSRWYREKLGMRVLMRLPKRGGTEGVILDGAGLVVELIQRDSSRAVRAIAPAVRHDVEVQGLYKVGFFVEEFDRVVATLRARGVEFAFGPFPARAEQPANLGVRDREGNLIQIFGR